VQILLKICSLFRSNITICRICSVCFYLVVIKDVNFVDVVDYRYGYKFWAVSLFCNVYDRASNSVILPKVSALYDRMPVCQPHVVRTTMLVHLCISWRLGPQDCGTICRTVSIKLYGNLITPLLPPQAAACGRRLDLHPVGWN